VYISVLILIFHGGWHTINLNPGAAFQYADIPRLRSTARATANRGCLVLVRLVPVRLQLFGGAA
jgi:hypothetical protein